MNRLKYFTAIIMSLFLFGISYAEELGITQKKFRASLQEFLKEEGFVPIIEDGDNNLYFKKEGTLYWISFGGTSPTYIELHRSGLKCEDTDNSLVLQAVNAANRKVRSAKAMFNDTSVTFAIEMYCHSPEEFKYIFYKCLNELENIKESVTEYYNGENSTITNTGSTSNSSDVSKFFPIYGLTLGKSTTRDMKAKGHVVKTVDSGGQYCDVKSLTFWDHDGDNIFESMYITDSDVLPELWEDGLGINWGLSYNQILSKFKNLGYVIEIDKAPITREYNGRKTLSADVTATSADGHLEFEFDFDYGNSNGEGYSVNSSYSLYSITIRIQ